MKENKSKTPVFKIIAIEDIGVSCISLVDLEKYHGHKFISFKTKGQSEQRRGSKYVNR